MLAALQVAGASAAATADCCWCDPTTPDDGKTTVGTDDLTYSLIFSDEFGDSKRGFANGDDSKWTALNIGDTSNKGMAFYLPEQATVVTDPLFPDVSSLRILTSNSSHTGDSPTGEKGIFMPFKSAMLQTWNKFCFTGGILEYRARMPEGGGYWPALWAFGNLGRAVYQDSNTGLWPWSYDQCDSRGFNLPPTDPPQRISACDDHDLEKEGLHGFQGRGATELDVLEGAVTNTGLHSYAVGSLQLSPGIPPYFRPPLFGFPTKSGPGSWYSGLMFGPDGSPNNGWYGPPWGGDCPTGCPDALSGGVTEISDFGTRYWTYRMEWKLGPEGFLKWIYDGEFVWGMPAAAFGEYSVCSTKGDEAADCVRTPARQIPEEPMSLVMNTAIGTWNGGASALDGKHWPASFYVDYVRVWQSEENVGCDPPNYPTAKYIDLHSSWYGEPAMPPGSETCPAKYPASAHAHAAALTERSELLRAYKKGDAAALATLTQKFPDAAAPLLARVGPEAAAAAASVPKATAPSAAAAPDPAVARLASVSKASPTFTTLASAPGFQNLAVAGSAAGASTARPVVGGSSEPSAAGASPLSSVLGAALLLAGVAIGAVAVAAQRWRRAPFQGIYERATGAHELSPTEYTEYQPGQ